MQLQRNLILNVLMAIETLLRVIVSSVVLAPSDIISAIRAELCRILIMTKCIGTPKGKSGEGGGFPTRRFST